MNWLKSTDKRFIWIALGTLMVILRIILGNFPSIIERFYSRGVYIWIRWILDHTIGLLPVPMLYVLILALLYVIIRRLFFKKRTPLSWPKRLLNAGFSLAAFLSAIVFFFLLLWGFNYGRVPMEQQIGIQPQPLSKEELLAELTHYTPKVLAARNRISTDSLPLTETYLPNDIQAQIQTSVESFLAEINYPDAGNPRLRRLRPKGVLLRISTAGFYNPLTGECHVDDGLHPLQLPFVMAHEYFHAYGFTDEGSCNFLAFMACSRSDDPFIQYSAYLSFWRYLAGGYRRYNNEVYRDYFNALPATLRNDLAAIHERMDQYPDILPEVRNFTYNTYLKAQGISEGMKNYSRIVMLVAAWRKEKGKE